MYSNRKHSHLIQGSQSTGKVAKRQCDINDGKNWIREEVVEYIPHETMKIDIYEGTMPLKKAIATLKFKQISNSQTELTMIMEIKKNAISLLVRSNLCTLN